LWGVALTGQRTGSFLLMRRDRLFEAEKVGKSLRGWKVVNWNADEMKGGRDGGRSHSLPIPPNALREPRIIAAAGNRGHLWGEQHGIETRTKRNHSWVNWGRLTIGGNYSRSS